MLTEAQAAAYRRDGFIVVEDVLDADRLAAIRATVARLVAGAAAVDAHDDVYDLEPGHSRATPRVRRIKAPHKVDPVFDAVIRDPKVIAILQAQLGPDLRLHGSKLNMKSPEYGSPVEWHQDWAFYPHTNDDLLAVGVMLDRGQSMGLAMDAAGVPSWPKARQSMERQVRWLGKPRLEKLTDWLVEINYGMKGGNQLPERGQLERLVVKLARPPQAKRN